MTRNEVVATLALVSAVLGVCTGGRAGDGSAPDRAAVWLERLRSTSDSIEATAIGFRGARDPDLVNSVLEELLAETKLEVDPVRIAVRLPRIDADLVRLGTRLVAARRLLRCLGPLATDPQRESLSDRLRKGRSSGMEEVALLSVSVLRAIPDSARDSIEHSLMGTPPSREAVLAVILEPGLGRARAVQDHLAKVAEGGPTDPLVVLAAGLASGKREEAAKRLVEIAHAETDPFTAISFLEMIGILDAEPRRTIDAVLNLVEQRPELATGALRLCLDGDVPDDADARLRRWLASEEDSLRSAAARILFLSPKAEGHGGRVGELTELADSADPELREVAAWGLSRIVRRGFDGAQALGKLVADKEGRVQAAALAAARHVGAADPSLRRAVVSLAARRDHPLCVDAMEVLSSWGDPALKPTLQRHLAQGGSASRVVFLALREGWDDMVALCLERFQDGDLFDRAQRVLVSLIRSNGSPEREGLREWARLPNDVAIDVALYCQMCGLSLPTAVLADMEKRLWQWGDDVVGDLDGRFDTLRVLWRGGRLDQAKLSEALMRLFAVMLADADAEPAISVYAELWQLLASRVDPELLPMWYFDRMMRDPRLPWEIRHACRLLVEGRTW